MAKEWTKQMERAAQNHQIALNQWESRKSYLVEPYRQMHLDAITKTEAKLKKLGIPGF